MWTFERSDKVEKRPIKSNARDYKKWNTERKDNNWYTKACENARFDFTYTDTHENSKSFMRHEHHLMQQNASLVFHILYFVLICQHFISKNIYNFYHCQCKFCTLWFPCSDRKKNKMKIVNKIHRLSSSFKWMKISSWNIKVLTKLNKYRGVNKAENSADDFKKWMNHSAVVVHPFRYPGRKDKDNSYKRKGKQFDIPCCWPVRLSFIRATSMTLPCCSNNGRIWYKEGREAILITYKQWIVVIQEKSILKVYILFLCMLLANIIYKYKWPNFYSTLNIECPHETATAQDRDVNRLSWALGSRARLSLELISLSSGLDSIFYYIIIFSIIRLRY